MFSVTNEYALRIITHLAMGGPTPIKNPAIAQATQVPPGYLYKVLQMLDAAGLVRGFRGRNGGFILSRPPEKISVLDVIEAIDPLPRIRSCALHLKSHEGHLCPLHEKLDESIALVENILRSSTIADLIANPNSIPMCETPQPLKISVSGT